MAATGGGWLDTAATQSELSRTLGKANNSSNATSPNVLVTESVPEGDFNARDPPTERELVTFLFEDYQRGARPIRNYSQLLEIDVSYQIQSADINELHEVMTTFGWLALTWRDDYLNWTHTRFQPITHVIPPAAWVWTPPVIVYNRQALGEAWSQLMADDLPVSLYRNGTVLYDSTGILASSCTLNLRFFPFDHQTCRILFGCADKMVLNCKTVGRKFEEQTRTSMGNNGQWRLINASCTDRIYNDPKYVNVVVEIKLTLGRKPIFFLTTLIFPTIVISLLTALVFAQPVEAGEKVSLGITLLLTFTVFLLMIVGFMPPTSNTPLFAIYLNISLGLSALSLIFAVIVTNLHNSTTEKHPPAWLKRMTRAHCHLPARTRTSHTGTLNRSMSSRSRDVDFHRDSVEGSYVVSAEGGGGNDPGYTQGNDSQPCKPQHQTSPEEKMQQIRDEWTSVAKGLDRIMLILYIIISIVMAALLIGIPMWHIDH